MAGARSKDEDRLFVRDGWRHFRRRYSLTEVGWGIATAAVLVAVGTWVGWRGAHPEPGLYVASASGPAAVGTAAATTERGPMPDGLAGPGWTEGALSQFEPDTLYVKINGRADYFLSFGFQRLHYAPLVREQDDEATVDVELYDLGTAANSLGAFAGERKAGASAQAGANGMTRFARNAMFLTRGRYYIRAIGSDESEEVLAQLRHLQSVFDQALAGDGLPWAFELFSGQLGLEATAVTYHRESAFSFGFARDVHAATLADDTELFVVALDSEVAAEELAEQYVAAFAKYGEPVAGTRFAKDRYLGAFSTATSSQRWVLGVRGAPDLAAGKASLARLMAGFAALPPEVRERAIPSSELAAPEQSAPVGTDGSSPSSGEEPMQEGGSDYQGEPSYGAEPGE